MKSKPLLREGATAPGYLFEAGTGEQTARSVAYQVKPARFSAYRDIASFDFASNESNKALLLHRRSG